MKKSDLDNEYTYFEYLLFKYFNFIGKLEGISRKLVAKIINNLNTS